FSRDWSSDVCSSDLGGGFAAHPGQGDEVVPRRRAGGGPLQGAAVAPRVVDADRLAVLGGLPDVVEERQQRHAQQERGDGGGRVQGRSEEYTSELQSRENLVCRLLLEI